jgi:hypothetical protein
MEIIETSVFTRQIRELITDDEYAELKFALIQRPEQGAVIPGSGGIRKIRWAGSGRGKRGGIRVIYYWQVDEHQIFMLLAYAKNTQDNLTPAQLTILRKLVEQEINNG